MAANISDKSAKSISSNEANQIIQKETQEKGAVAVDDYPKPIADLLQQLIDNSVSEAEKTSVSDTNMEQESSAKNSLFGSITVLAASKQPANYTTPRVAAILRNNYKLALSLNAKSNQFKSYIPIPFIKNKVDVTFGAFANSYKTGAFTALVKGNGAWNLTTKKGGGLSYSGTYYVYGRKTIGAGVTNVNYGYMGRVLGIPEAVLRAGEAGYSFAHGGLKYGPFSFFDQPRDSAMIAYGFNLYNRRIRF